MLSQATFAERFRISESVNISNENKRPGTSDAMMMVMPERIAS